MELTTLPLQALCGSCMVGVGGMVGAALGPFGRSAEVSVLVGDGGRSTSCAYSCSKGAYAGLSLEGGTLAIRNAVNLSFYGYPVKVSHNVSVRCR
jgi:lipid-binding SYLF domain-containing protein